LEYVTGETLREIVIQHGALPESTVLEWAGQLASVLEYLHSHEPPLIHRDLTPENIIVRKDRKLTVIDFGSANEFLGQATGTFVGKQAYTSPEQFRGKATPQSDIYALGCTLHYLLTGGDPEPLSQSHPCWSNKDVSRDLNQLVAD